MQTANFPERKNKRRKVALFLLKERIATGKNNNKFSNEEVAILEERIVPSRRNEHSKKQRASSL